MTLPEIEPFADLRGRNAVVTGASSGIGRAIALELARGGANVLVHYAQSLEKAENVASEIREIGLAATVIAADFGNANELPEFVTEAFAAVRKVDIWVNNAGVDLLTGEGRELSYEQKLERLLDVDVRATTILSKMVAERMVAAESGVILNIGWDQADRGMEGDSGELFACAKNAIMGLTRSLAMSYAPHVRVNCVAPGWIRTAWGDQTSDEWHERVRRETPLDCWGKPEDVAKVARFLASDDAAYLTGQVINVNGGAIR